jgi:hypothetical protein
VLGTTAWLLVRRVIRTSPSPSSMSRVVSGTAMVTVHRASFAAEPHALSVDTDHSGAVGQALDADRLECRARWRSGESHPRSRSACCSVSGLARVRSSSRVSRPKNSRLAVRCGSRRAGRRGCPQRAGSCPSKALEPPGETARRPRPCCLASTSGSGGGAALVVRVAASLASPSSASVLKCSTSSLPGGEQCRYRETPLLEPRTVRNHVSHVFTKLRVADRAQTIVRARAAGARPTTRRHSVIRRIAPTRPRSYDCGSFPCC